MSVAVKICGLTDEAAISAVIAAGADYAGFVFYPASPRHLPLGRAAQLKALLPVAIPSVSVVVDPDDALLADIYTTLNPDYLQLHGKESPARIAEIKDRYPDVKLIKALPIRASDDVAKAQQYESLVDMLLFDAIPIALPGMLPGGNGLSFDWALLAGRKFSLPWMLSGGLNAENIAQAIRQSGVTMVDVSSGVESAPGVKDPVLIEQFVKAAKRA